MALIVILASIAAGVALVVGVIAVTPYSDMQDKPDTWRDDELVVFHVILADSTMYGVDGAYHDSFEVVPKSNDETYTTAQYAFDFVPSGSSPDVLTITLSGRGGDGEKFEHTAEFVLQGTRHEAGLGEFYTWEYKGDNTITLPQQYTDKIDIVIDPNGSTQGAVSVYLVRVASDDTQE